MGPVRLLKIFRRKVEPRLIYSPFLRLILFNVWFQLGFAVFLCGVAAGALYLPKIWKVSPPGFLPEIKISWLDKTQNWSLKKSARKYASQGDFVRAARSWEGAVAQNPADESALRGFLTNCLKIARPDKRTLASAAAQIPWLLRLTETNSADLELSAVVCEHLGWSDLTTYWFGAMADRLPPRAEAAYTKALFYQGRVPEFESHLKRALTLNDPEIPFFQQAQAAAGFGAQAAAAERALRMEALSGTNSVLATRLLMITAAKKKDPLLYQTCLERLARRDEATAVDQAAYWQLLAESGAKAEAIQRAESFTTAPSSPLELVQLARTYAALGLETRARELFDRFATVFPHLTVWSTYASMLIRERDWDQLRRTAVRMREDSASQSMLWGYSFYLEGRAELEQKRTGSAEIAFRRAADSHFDSPATALEVGRELTRLGYPKLGLQVLSPFEKVLGKQTDYWDALFETGMVLQDQELVLRAAKRAYELNPGEITVLNRYAAALLLNRTRPEEAIQLTLQLLAKYPESPVAMINHASALLLNRRPAEARVLLEKLDPARLPLLERSAWHFAMFEACCELGRWQEAWKASDQVSRTMLFPIQRQWMEQKQKSMPVRGAAESSV